MVDFLSLRESFISEARSSPNLLADLAGLERYISETYNSRSFVELIQNAEDAESTHFKVIALGEKLVIIANNGRPFNEDDINSLCRSAASKKDRGTTIGYRGIGFKSVVNLCTRVHLISGEYKITFCRELTLKEVPEADDVPLVRIPHPLDHRIKSLTSRVISIERRAGMSTFFIFENLDSSSVQSELNDLDSSVMLFLKNLSCIDVHTKIQRRMSISKELYRGHSMVTLLTENTQDDFLVFSDNKHHCSLAIRLTDSQPVFRMSQREAVVHSFIPSFEPSGINSRIQGDVSTDPSRTRIILDSRTDSVITSLAGFIVKKLLKIVSADSSRVLPVHRIFFAAVIPSTDPRSTVYQKVCFSTKLYDQLKNAAKGNFSNVHIRPRWINPDDYYLMLDSSNVLRLHEDLAHAKDSERLTRLLGFHETSVYELLESVNSIRLSLSGCAQILSQLIALHSIGKLEYPRLDLDHRIWFSGESAVSYPELIEQRLEVHIDMINLIIENVASQRQIQSFLRRFLGDDNILSSVFDSETQTGREQHQARQDSISPLSQLPLSRPRTNKQGRRDMNSLDTKRVQYKWRTAEEVFAQIFRDEGWNVEDVTKKNVGYDYHCTNDSGEEIFVEVKKIKYQDDSFELTMNEEVVAREKGDRYAIALIRDCPEDIEICMLYDPLKKMKLSRRIKSWVWLCEDFPYEPSSYQKNS